MDYFSASRGGETGWAQNPKFGYRCEVVNYSPRSVFNVEIELALTFRQALPVADNPHALAEGPITLERPWTTPIAKLDGGPTGSFV